jgi:EAL domain-containing protein (putative c-di-GMP-specific phosphodiesterase class I)
MHDAIEIELTESMIMSDIEGNVRKLNEVREAGIKIAIDDFGTGYSSLSYLAQLPLDTLKVDRSFVSAMTDSPVHMAIVTTIISLARSLNLRVVAEGVETEEQANLLRLLNCDEAQGYLYSKPLPPQEIAKVLRPARVVADVA